MLVGTKRISSASIGMSGTFAGSIFFSVNRGLAHSHGTFANDARIAQLGVESGSPSQRDGLQYREGTVVHQKSAGFPDCSDDVDNIGLTNDDRVAGIYGHIAGSGYR